MLISATNMRRIYDGNGNGIVRLFALYISGIIIININNNIVSSHRCSHSHIHSYMQQFYILAKCENSAKPTRIILSFRLGRYVTDGSSLLLFFSRDVRGWFSFKRELWPKETTQSKLILRSRKIVNIILPFAHQFKNTEFLSVNRNCSKYFDQLWFFIFVSAFFLETFESPKENDIQFMMQFYFTVLLVSALLIYFFSKKMSIFQWSWSRHMMCCCVFLVSVNYWIFVSSTNLILSACKINKWNPPVTTDHQINRSI